MASYSTSFTIDTTQIRKMARDLEATVPGMSRSVTEAMKVSALVVAMEARALSSWSSRIPGSVRVVGGAKRIMVRAGSGNAPHAAPYEHFGMPGSFRHPVFGHRNRWVSQNARPFLGPALEHKAGEFERAVYLKVDRVFSEAGFH